MVGSECLFCKIVDGRIPASIVHQDEQVVAFRDIAPQAPVHMLVVPKLHIPSLEALEREHQALVGHMVLVAQKLARQAGLAENGYRLVLNCGRDGGQTVFHLHLHLLGGTSLAGRMA